jgi:hypothetical protein
MPVAERSTTGLLEFDTKQDAVEGLVLVNHQEVPNPCKSFLATSSLVVAHSILFVPLGVFFKMFAPSIFVVCV